MLGFGAKGPRKFRAVVRYSVEARWYCGSGDGWEAAVLVAGKRFLLREGRLWLWLQLWCIVVIQSDRFMVINRGKVHPAFHYSILYLCSFVDSSTELDLFMISCTRTSHACTLSHSRTACTVTYMYHL